MSNESSKRKVGQFTQICRSCGALGNVRNKTPGSVAIEILLWLCFLIPGLIYSLSRHSRKHSVCGQCGSAELVQAGSPVGRQLIAQFHSDVEVGGAYGGGVVANTRRVIDTVLRWTLYAIGAFFALGIAAAFLNR